MANDTQHETEFQFRCGECQTDFPTAEARMAHRVETGHKPATKGSVRSGVTVTAEVREVPAPEMVPSSAPTFRRSGQANQPPKASDKSVAYLRTLLGERTGEVVERVRAEANTARTMGYLTQRSVSDWIDALKAAPKAEVAPAVAPAPRPQVARTNRFGGRCVECGSRVDAEAGTLQRGEEGWEVRHREGECPVTEFPFPFGSYAIDNDEGDVRFYSADQDGLFVLASDNLHRVHPSSQAAIIEKIAADPEGASRRFGQVWITCGRCGRGLTDTTPGGSRDQGIGPVCAKKGW